MQRVGLAQKTLAYLRDPGVKTWRKFMGLFAALYVIWPLDLIPDAIPVIGWLDDLGVVSLVAWFVVRDIRRHAKQVEEAARN